MMGVPDYLLLNSLWSRLQLTRQEMKLQDMAFFKCVRGGDTSTTQGVFALW